MIEFPRTPHLAWLGQRSPREDKILSRTEAEEFLAGPIVIEEKIDGANLGIAKGEHGRLAAWNRGSPILIQEPQRQFRPFPAWLAAREEALVSALAEHLVLFGEWCHAVHSIRYDRLPDWFLLFDVYDRREERFWSTRRRDALGSALGLHSVPVIAKGRFAFDALKKLLSTSRYADGPAEGLVLRREDDDWLHGRAKIVRPEFLEGIGEHWTRRPLRHNRILGHAGFSAEEVQR